MLLNRIVINGVLSVLATGFMGHTARAESPSLTCAKALYGSKLKPVAPGIYAAFASSRYWIKAVPDGYERVPQRFTYMLVASDNGIEVATRVFYYPGERLFKSKLLPTPYLRITMKEDYSDFTAEVAHLSGWEKWLGPSYTSFDGQYADPTATTKLSSVDQIPAELRWRWFMEAFEPIISDRLDQIVNRPYESDPLLTNGEIETELRMQLGMPNWLWDAKEALWKQSQELQWVNERGYLAESNFLARQKQLTERQQALEAKIAHAKAKGVWQVHAPSLSDDQIKRGEEFMMACAPFVLSSNAGLLKFRANAYGMVNGKYFTERGEFEKFLESIGGGETIGLPKTQK
jgi:hypothetical protein